MNQSVVIIGSGFASYQLVKALRKQDAERPITVITANNGDEYSKPDLSHVFTKKQQAADLVKMSGEDFARELNINLMSFTRVEAIEPEQQYLIANGERIDYGKLVLAMGARPFVPAISGNAAETVITLNSLEDYQLYQQKLNLAKRVLVIGAGLVGTEIAMDLLSAGREVVLTDRASQIMPGLLPEYLSSRLFQTLSAKSCAIELDAQVSGLNRVSEDIEVQMADGKQFRVDAVISAVGLKPATKLAEEAGLQVNKGIVVNPQLQTSNPDIYALGDCAEIEGKVLPFLQPIMLSANTLAKNLLGQSTSLMLPAMLVKVKTPLLPMQLSGKTSGDDLSWKIDASNEGMLARAFNDNDELVGFIATEAMMPKAFPLLRELPAII